MTPQVVRETLMYIKCVRYRTQLESPKSSFNPGPSDAHFGSKRDLGAPVGDDGFNPRKPDMPAFGLQKRWYGHG